MFTDLFALVKQTRLTMVLDANADTGVMTAVVTPTPLESAASPALCSPMILTGTPEEFDASFTTSLLAYMATRTTMAEQVAAAAQAMQAHASAAQAKSSGAATAGAKSRATTAPKAAAGNGKAAAPAAPVVAKAAPADEVTADAADFDLFANQPE